MNKNILLTIFAAIILLAGLNYFKKTSSYNIKLENLKQAYSIKPSPSVDHTKLPALQKPFSSPQAVTSACISCHTERHKEVMMSSHWNWERVSYIEGRGVSYLGKKNLLNNFCIGSNTNEQSCAKCHIGFGMTNDHFDFNNAVNVDCMVCHDNSEEYLKGSALAGYPDRKVNLTKVAQSVGSPKKANCGACHFYSGGGNNVKHGDLEEAILTSTRDIDVHMASNGMNLECIACHRAPNHKMLGKLYSVSSSNIDRSTCESCHSASPHFDQLLNKHFAKVSCQACHIPTYAKANATKMSWKWSKAGKLKDGKPFHIDNKDGNHTYLSTKGEFKWAKNVKPDYVWFNGTADHYILGDLVSTIPVQMNTLNGSYDDPSSKIIPVKIHRGDQIYDKENKYLIQPHLYAPQVGDSAFWQDFDWNLASASGMKRVGLPYSGKYDFVETEMYWPINHMVATSDKALSCHECHTRKEGRLASLAGFYLPGRDNFKLLDMLGWLMAAASLLGVASHSSIRVFLNIRGRR